ncbi:hypothetical protein DLR63_06700 [Vibrio tarriae]|nr:hypothetical protein DLR59_10995 [Vibrio tarriae]RBM28521.1 hypothetical protein DLR61_12460 [Vibrio tarriae]RBM40459.1 hypothetical protein DLR63_06700 [Vibrio tarriae]RBM53610.1 hypothetical protein DLR64_06915 [Vibrio tarriae]
MVSDLGITLLLDVAAALATFVHPIVSLGLWGWTYLPPTCLPSPCNAHSFGNRTTDDKDETRVKIVLPIA